ncbi:hypothetical protein AVO42_06635 [Thiomicrospira sp. XS5]|uniref:hypothetical protein n=1 Tax=Thiomicrospira sp. XS5 TaxID=1775636 RepID=UPI0007478094|nr:hypothetical protein [Thiomicrospira sp. XS5]KUJ75030.1 hypothetical protein AVO42_06635 [Thiomicrospira sp. XS5]
MARFLKWLGLIMVVVGVVAVIWALRETFRETGVPVVPDKPDTVEAVAPVKAPDSMGDAPTQEETDARLNLRLPAKNTVPSHEGPQMKAADIPLKEPEKAPSINDLLPDNPIEKRVFNYSYEGEDKDNEDKYNVKLGVQDEDVKVNVGVGVQTGEKRTDLNSIDIEMKLPESSK